MAHVQARTCASAPFEAAAAFAQAARPIQRVAFNAACRVVAPDPPRNAGKDAPTLWPAHKPAWQAKRSDKHLPVEVGLNIRPMDAALCMQRDRRFVSGIPHWHAVFASPAPLSDSK